jgi:hypothetical protein
LFLSAAAFSAIAQTVDDAVRMTVTMNADGSKTVYQTNGTNHQSVATTTGADGKPRGKIIYRLDAEGRYESGPVFAANGALRFKTLYKYDATGRLAEETQMAKDDSVLHKIVYSFDEEGHTRAVIRFTTAPGSCSVAPSRRGRRRTRTRIASRVASLSRHPVRLPGHLSSLGNSTSRLASRGKGSYQVNA